jgi:hypothetical protein
VVVANMVAVNVAVNAVTLCVDQDLLQEIDTQHQLVWHNLCWEQVHTIKCNKCNKCNTQIEIFFVVVRLPLHLLKRRRAVSFNAQPEPLSLRTVMHVAQCLRLVTSLQNQGGKIRMRSYSWKILLMLARRRCLSWVCSMVTVRVVVRCHLFVETT